MTQKSLISFRRVTPMGDPRRAQLREHGGGNRRQDPPRLKPRINVNELLGHDTSKNNTGMRAIAPVQQPLAGVFDRLPTAPVWMKQRQSPEV
jgi:hypothetical protein